MVNTQDSIPKPKEKHAQYFRIGIDLSKVARSFLTNRYSTSEFLAETIWKKKLHYLIEGGVANSNKNGEHLKFSSSSYFVRLGFDKYFFGSLYQEDLDNAFVGVRIAGAYNKNNEAQVTLWDPFYGNSIITKPPTRRLMYWLELTAGFRIEMTQNIFVGWNIRAKTFINGKNMQEQAPEYLAGYGIARKVPTLDYNLYLLYGFGKR